MAKDKKVPSGDTKGRFFTPETEMTLFGLMLTLVALIGFLNSGPVGKFLFYIFAYIFGVFCFIPFIMLLCVGLYLIVQRKVYKPTIGIGVLGGFLILIGLAIASSNSETLTIKNMISEFNIASNTGNITLFNIPSWSSTVALGGGFVGYFLASILNSAITSIGTMVFYIVLILVGVGLVVYKPICVFTNFIQKKKQKKTDKDDVEDIKKDTSVSKLEPISEVALNKDYCEALDNQSNPFVKSNEYSSVRGPAVEPIRAHFVSSNASRNDNTNKFIESSSTNDEDDPILANDIDEDPIPLKQSESLFLNNQEETVPDCEEEEEPSIMVEDEEIEQPKPNEIPFSRNEVYSKVVDDAFSHSAPKPIIKNTNKVEDDKFIYPGLELLNEYENQDVDSINEQASIDRQNAINSIFNDLNIGAKISSYKIGPSVTRFDVLTNRDVSVNNVSKYIDDVAVRLGGVNARFEKVVKGKMTSGLEIPNKKSVMVSFKECIKPYLNNKDDKFMIPLGKDITGDVIGVKVTDFPHLLVAGATGSGKSIFIHNLIMSLLMKTKPEECKIMLIDPKRVEMSKYKEMPHLICPIISETDKSKVALDKLVLEMERRYKLFEDAGVSKISQYNEYAEDENIEKLPVIVVVIDEYANLVDSCREIATPVVRIAQKSRAAGIHLIISTQRPSVNVITGVIKGNLPSRIALRVASAVDSQTILGEGGAEKLLGYGDLLVDSPEIDGVGLTRLQCPYVDNKEIRRVVEFLKANYKVNYDAEFLDLTVKSSSDVNFNGNNGVPMDERYEDVKAYVMERNETSISDIQREFSFGFPRAGRIFNMLVKEGIIASESQPGSSKRKVIKKE